MIVIYPMDTPFKRAHYITKFVVYIYFSAVVSGVTVTILTNYFVFTLHRSNKFNVATKDSNLVYCS